ncbi:MAG: hypothetical protein JNK10_09810 [Cyclobacteriaceae bacterium]|nr:hypothetical protein [Cyclobacteriaceae bacterium]
MKPLAVTTFLILTLLVTPVSSNAGMHQMPASEAIGGLPDKAEGIASWVRFFRLPEKIKKAIHDIVSAFHSPKVHRSMPSERQKRLLTKSDKRMHRAKKIREYHWNGQGISFMINTSN